MESLLKRLHFFVLLWTLWEVGDHYEQHMIQLEEAMERKPVVEKNIEAALNKQKGLEKYLKDVDDAKERIELVAQEVEKLTKQLPSEILDLENMGMIRNIAAGVKIKDARVNFGKEESRDFYLVKPYTFTGVGTFLQFLIFFEKIAESERLLNINSFSLKKTEGNNRGRFQTVLGNVVIEAYKFNPKFREDRGISQIENNNESSRNTKSGNSEEEL